MADFIEVGLYVHFVLKIIGNIVSNVHITYISLSYFAIYSLSEFTRVMDIEQ